MNPEEAYARKHVKRVLLAHSVWGTIVLIYIIW